MKQNLPTMSSILRKWLLLGTLTVFVLTRLVMFFLQYRTEIRDIDRLLTITLRDVSHDIQRAADEDLIVTARQIAETYDSNGNRNLDDCLGMLLGSLFDLGSACSRCNYHQTCSLAVAGDAQVELPFDIHGLADQDLPDDLAFRTGLLGYQLHAQHGLCNCLCLLRGFGELHPAGLSATTAVHLSLDYA